MIRFAVFFEGLKERTVSKIHIQFTVSQDINLTCRTTQNIGLANT